MQQQAMELRAEGTELYAFLKTLPATDWDRSTPFKGWTPNDVIGHLHAGDWAVVLSMTEPEKYHEYKVTRQAARDRGDDAAAAALGPELETGAALREQWYGYFRKMCEAFAADDPKRRIEWVGPDMSVRMAATARMMETWAHGQEIYDLLRRPRAATDRLKSIATIGVKTFNWTFVNRGEPVPKDVPDVKLTAPSGLVWDFPGNHAPETDCYIEGAALDFCRVVTQGRNIKEVGLTVVGDAAQAWMNVAQCFAGPPRNPPEPGVRGWPGDGSWPE